MNILMMTNTFTPHVGGVARSVQSFTDEYRRRGHRVVVVASPFDEKGPRRMRGEEDVVRVPAIRRFYQSGFSVPLPAPGFLTAALKGFRADIVHVHHPFLLGATGLVVGRVHGAPVVFTHHTLYEHYTQYMPGDSRAMKRFAANLSAGFADMADRVFAPSQSLKETLRERGVKVRIDVVPTGVELPRWKGDGARWRGRNGVPPDALVLGHAGRLAPEKNLRFLCRAAAEFVRRRREAWFVVVGDGPEKEAMRRFFRRKKLEERLLLTGELSPESLPEALNAMDLFAFTSQSETQGMVVTEAMACGLPVVALDGPGVRDVVRDGVNGRLLAPGADAEKRFVRGLISVAGASSREMRRLRAAARRTAEKFSMTACADKALGIYEKLREKSKRPPTDGWETAARWMSAQWSLFQNVTASAGKSVAGALLPGKAAA